MEEHDLIQLSKKGDLESFNRLVEIYQSPVYNLALRMVGNAQSAEDATQEAFLSAWKGIRNFKGGSFRAWLMCITANSCRDQLRKQKHNPTSLEELAVEPESTSSGYSPEDFAIRREFHEQIQVGLDRLSAEQRLSVILCDIQGLSYEEIAQVMGCSIGTVKSRINRGRSQLRDFLIERELFPEKFRHNK